MKLVFSRQTFESTHTSNFTKIRPVGAELLHEDRYDEAHSHFSQVYDTRLKIILSVRYELGPKEQLAPRPKQYCNGQGVPSVRQAPSARARARVCVRACVRDGSHNLVTITHERWLCYNDTASYV
jgi:hypothetical protein